MILAADFKYVLGRVGQKEVIEGKRGLPRHLPVVPAGPGELRQA